MEWDDLVCGCGLDMVVKDGFRDNVISPLLAEHYVIMSANCFPLYPSKLESSKPSTQAVIEILGMFNIFS